MKYEVIIWKIMKTIIIHFDNIFKTDQNKSCWERGAHKYLKS